MIRFTMDNTEGYSKSDLVALNEAFKILACANTFPTGSLEHKSYDDHISERLIARYDDGIRARDLLV